MTNAELLDLLREARERLCDNINFLHDVTVCRCRKCKLARRIDAALAAARGMK